MTSLPSGLKIDVTRIVPPTLREAQGVAETGKAPEPAPAVATPTPAAASALTVYRPSALDVAERMSNVATTLDTRVAPLTRQQKQVKVITDWWGLPLVAGGVGALGLGIFAEVATVVPWLVAGVGAAMSTVGALVHPKLRRQAAELAPPLLQGELREEVLRLETASRDFPASEAGSVQAPEVQAFVANRAKELLARTKDAYHGTNDTDLVRVLERLASQQARLTPEETRLLAFTELCLKASSNPYGERGVPAAFARLTDAQQRELAPFVRERFFNEDGLKKSAVYGEESAYFELHKTLDAIGCKTEAPYPTTPTQIPAPTASHGDVVASLGKLAHFDDLFAWGDRAYRHETHGPAAAEKAVAYAIAPRAQRGRACPLWDHRRAPPPRTPRFRLPPPRRFDGRDRDRER